jgi:uncharacterized protein YjdB
VTVTVAAAPVPLEGISLNPGSLNMIPGGTASLTVIYNPANTTQQGVTWSTSNTAVATVNSSTGAITAVAVGSATITATSTGNGSISASCTVTVTSTEVPLTGISLNTSTLALDKGQNQTLVVTYTPPDTTQTGVTWLSSDTTVATVTNGTVIAVGGGTAAITATSTADPTKTASCTVTVTVPLVGISIPSSFTMGVGSSSLLTVTYNPTNTTEQGVTWSSDNTEVATVDSSTGEITAVSVGTTTITARSTANDTISDTCTVTVQASFTGAGVNIVFEGFEDETITLDVTVNNGDTFVITAPAGFDRYLWYVDNERVKKYNPVMTYPLSGLTPGRHSITVIVDEDGYHFSKTLTYTVEY